MSKETEAGTVKEKARDDGAKIIGWTDVGTESGTGTERARADRAKTIGSA